MSIWILLGTHIFQHLFTIAHGGDLSWGEKKRREGDCHSYFPKYWLHCTRLHTYGSVNLNLRTKGSEFQFSCAAKDCLAFPDKLWVSVPPLLNKGLHSLWGTTIVPFCINTPCISIVWHDEQRSKPRRRVSLTCSFWWKWGKKGLKWERTDSSTYTWTHLLFCFQRGSMDIVSFKSHNRPWRLTFMGELNGEI